jgi:hypothetical protein
VRQCIRFGVSGLLWMICAVVGVGQEPQSLILRIKAVGKEGAGNVEAARAWKALVARGPAVMPEVLVAMDDASPIARNWLRSAIEALQDRARDNRNSQIPADKLEAFLQDTKHAGDSRRLAYECLVRLDPSTPGRWLPKLLDDPSPELRRDAVAVQLDHGKNAPWTGPQARQKFFEDLLKHARDHDQVNAICDILKKDYKIQIDLTRHYGFVTRWLLIGPFDNGKGVGFHNVYPPEQAFDAKGAYPGKNGDKVAWREHSTDKPLGLVDLNKCVGELHGTVAYGYAAVASEAERPVEVRAASNNAVRIWLNGKEIYFREEYHHGMEIDQHVGKGVLKAGRNVILIKVCQNEQTEDWAQLWSFQLRVCDHLGAAVPMTNVTEKVK